MFKCVAFQIVGLRFLSIALVNVSICQMYCQHGFEHSTAAEAAAVTTSKWRRTQLFVGKKLIKKKNRYTALLVWLTGHIIHFCKY